MKNNTTSKPEAFFIFSHSSQIRYYAVFAQAIKTYKPNIQLVLFVHGMEEVKIGQETNTFDEIIDFVQDFVVEKSEMSRVNQLIIQTEKEYGHPFMWEDVKIDRWLTNVETNTTIQYLNHCSEVLNEAIERLNPILGFSEFTRAIYRFAKRKFDILNIDYLHFECSRYFANFLFYDNMNWSNVKVDEYYKYYLRHPDETPKNILSLYDNILKRTTKLSYQNNFTVNTGYEKFTLISGIKKVYNVLFKHKENRNVNNPMSSLIDTGILKKIGRTIKHRLNKRYYDKIITRNVDLDRKFSMYFLHYQPEYTVEGLGIFYTDQAFLIENIASAIPADHLLYVKEHRPMIGLRDKQFYERITKHKNVVLIDHYLNGFNLIEKCQLVFTISGTAAMEAMYLGKQAIVFSKYFGETRFINFCDSFWKLKELIHENLQKKLKKGEAKQHSLAYLAARYKVSRKGQTPLAENEIISFVSDLANTKIVKQSMVEEIIERGI